MPRRINRCEGAIQDEIGGGIMPLFDDRAVGALERGMDAMWLKQQVASHNIANVETPGYKA